LLSGSFLSRLRRRLVREDGVALVAAIGISAALTIAGTSMIGYTTTSQRSAKRDGATQASHGLAEGGLSHALAVLSNPSNAPTDGSLLPEQNEPMPGGSATWSGTYDRANAIWTLNSTGYVKNPAAPAQVQRRASVRVRVTPVYTQPLATDAWDYLYTTKAYAGGSCDVNVAASATVTSPLYANGNMCLNNLSSVGAGPLTIKGTVYRLAPSATVGTLAAPISAAHIGVGCLLTSVSPLPPVSQPCRSVDNVFTQPGASDQVIPNVTAPTPEWAKWYRYAAPGPSEPCTAAIGSPPVFENETLGATMNSSVSTSATAVSLTPPMSYSCRVGPVDAPIGQLSWDAVTRTLTVNGTVFIDGSAKVDNGLVNTYVGQGTLYLSGTLLISSSTKLCARVLGADCDFAGWDPRAPGSSMLTVVVNGNGNGIDFALGTSIQLGSSASFEGMLYATNQLALGSSSQLKGGVVAKTVRFSSGAKTYNFPALDMAPTGTPGAEASYSHVNPPQDYAG
jgi:hypothetical protein